MSRPTDRLTSPRRLHVLFMALAILPLRVRPKPFARSRAWMPVFSSSAMAVQFSG
ncbi:MAG: hypothetical protein LBQ12_04165 [Deltaproteobacteria bacterium]|nr:hypothetical protein [Deltaproteobacteria bacterium]